MAILRVMGGHPLQGEITPEGSKNEALEVLCAALLTKDPVTFHNVPAILDVKHLLELFKLVGVSVKKLSSNSYEITAKNLHDDALSDPLFIEYTQKIRASVMLFAPLLARLGHVKIASPGGDKIGRRRIDVHIMGLQKMGVSFSYAAHENSYTARTHGFKGADLLLEEASVTGTANLVMAASLAQGTTEIYPAACEPHVQQLCKILVAMGAKIRGVGSNRLTIEGVAQLHGAVHTLMPDPIEVGSFIGLAALNRADLTIKDAYKADLGIIPSTFAKLGIQVEARGDDMHILPQESYPITSAIDGSILTVSDGIWPGFPPDLLSMVLVTAIQARGHVLIHQKMFESRLFFVDSLIDMGAKIILCDPHRACVIGLDRRTQLHGKAMASPDLRAGISLLATALAAEGESSIHNIEQIDRGYQNIEERLRKLGAKIERLPVTK